MFLGLVTASLWSGSLMGRDVNLFSGCSLPLPADLIKGFWLEWSDIQKLLSRHCFHIDQLWFSLILHPPVCAHTVQLKCTNSLNLCKCVTSAAGGGDDVGDYWPRRIRDSLDTWVYPHSSLQADFQVCPVWTWICVCLPIIKVHRPCLSMAWETLHMYLHFVDGEISIYVICFLYILCVICSNSRMRNSLLNSRFTV